MADSSTMLKVFMLRFLLMPLLALIFAGIASVIARKNALLSKKYLIIFVLLSSLVMAVPGLLGFIGEAFFPWYYLTVQIICLGLGTGFILIYNRYLDKDVKVYRTLLLSLAGVITLTLGYYIFAMVFNLCGNYKSAWEEGYIASTSLLSFPIPVIFYWTYMAFIRIPPEIYSVWQYPVGSKEISMEDLDFDRLMVLDVECFRHPDDKARLRVRAKAPPDMNFGQWFKKFIDDYNLKFPNQPIAYLRNGETPHDWIFYCKRSFFHWRRLLDPELSIKENRILEHVTIISKRVTEHKEETF